MFALSHALFSLTLLLSSLACIQGSMIHKRLLSHEGIAAGLAPILVDQGGYVHGQGKYNNNCTGENRAHILRFVPLGYNAPNVLAGQPLFAQLPFAHDSVVKIALNGLPSITFGTDRRTTLLLTFYTGAVMTHVTCDFEDKGEVRGNLLTVCHTEVTLGITAVMNLPVKFKAAVNFFFEPEFCEIKLTSAHARIPSEVLGMPINMGEIKFHDLITQAQEEPN